MTYFGTPWIGPACPIQPLARTLPRCCSPELFSAILWRLALWHRNGRCNGRRRDIGNRLLEGVQLLSKRRDLLGKLFSLGLLSEHLVLNDLQLIDGLLL